MLLSVRPGTDRQNLLDTLQRCRDQVFNLQSGHQTAIDYLMAYLNWASDSAAVLHQQIGEADLNRLVLTQRYGQLLTALSGLIETGTDQFIYKIISMEVQQRVKSFDDTLTKLREHIEHWSLSDLFVVADSSFYIHHPVKLEDINLLSVTGFEDGAVHLLFPIAVLDELDGLKESKDKHVRWRAGYTLAVLDRLFSTGQVAARLRDADAAIHRTAGVRTGEINIEILFDPPGHARLPIIDDEIIDRAVAIQPLLRRHVTLLTYDTSQASRGRHAGLEVIKLNQARVESS